MIMRCQFCKSTNIKPYFFQKENKIAKNEIMLKFPALKQFRHNIFRRLNGVCRDCGLTQSLNLIQHDIAGLLYGNFGDFDVAHEFRGDRISKATDEYLTEARFGKRIRYYKNFFRSKTCANVGMFRYWNGSLLNMFVSEYNANIFGYETIDSCRASAADVLDIIPITLDYKAQITNLKCPEKLDVLICFHMFSHSVDIHSDMKELIDLVKPGGYIVFQDEIMIKTHNFAHMVHFTEQSFLNLLDFYFDEIQRVDDMGESPKHTTDYTFKGDNPDYIVKVV
jgi:hypothetical protein